MRRWLPILLMVLVTVLTAPVNAQNPVVFEQMRIDIWPEYDRPEVLVIYRIKLAAEVELPAQVSMRIPRDAGAPYNVAMEDMDGLLYNLAYSTEVEGDWLRVTFTAPSADVQLEYYDPALTRNGVKRVFEYSWAGDVQVNDLTISIQQPVNASNMQIFPNMGSGQPADDGLTYFNNQVGQVEPGTTFLLRINYDKADDELSAGPRPVQATEPLDSTTTGRTDFQGYLPWIIGGVGLLLIAGGAIWFVVNQDRNHSTFTGRARHKTSKPRPVVMEQPEGGDIYCHQCGKRAGPGDRFCRKCGARLRIE